MYDSHSFYSLGDFGGQKKNSLRRGSRNQIVRITLRFTRRRYSALTIRETSSEMKNAHQTPVTSPVTGR